MSTLQRLSALPLMLVAGFSVSATDAAPLTGQITVVGQILEAPCVLSRDIQSIAASCWISQQTLSRHIDTAALRTSNTVFYLEDKGLSLAFKEQRANTHLYQVSYQ